MRGVSVNDMILSFSIEYSMYLLVNSGKVYQKFCTRVVPTVNSGNAQKFIIIEKETQKCLAYMSKSARRTDAFW